MPSPTPRSYEGESKYILSQVTLSSALCDTGHVMLESVWGGGGGGRRGHDSGRQKRKSPNSSQFRRHIPCSDCRPTIDRHFLVAAFSSHARIWPAGGGGLGGSTIHSPPPLFCFVFLFSGDELAHASFTLWVWISPQRLSELRRLWTSVP